jgi:hypothetical protein
VPPTCPAISRPVASQVREVLEMSRPVCQVSCSHVPDHGKHASHPLRPAAEISAVLIGSEQITGSCAPDVPRLACP